jgi:DNA sulfur modification protein DndB
MGNEWGSPLYEKISASEMRQNYESPLTIASLTSALKNTHLLGNVRGISNTIIPGPLYWTDMDSSLKRAVKVISGYLKVFQEAMPEHWEIGSAPGGYLCTNSGITALFFVLRDIIEHIDKKAIENSTIRVGDMKTEELIDEIKMYCQPLVEHFASAPSELLAEYRKMVGHSGHLDCSYGMMEQINKQFPDFMTANLKKYLDEKKSESNEQAKIIVPKIQLIIAKDVIYTLKREFGEEEKGWWSQGVPRTIRLKVAKRREDDLDRPAFEESFDLIDYKQVILNNWLLFGKKYSRGTGNKKVKMSWMDSLNTIRRKVAHPERGRVAISELNFLNEILTWLEDNN